MVSDRSAFYMSHDSANKLRDIQTAQMPTSPVSTVVHQISEQARLQPAAIALCFGNLTLSYSELQIKVNQLAAYLKQHASVSGGTVAICLERSADWVIAALAIMRIGAAYVPLDPAWPEARIKFAIKDSGAAAVVARTATLNHLQYTIPGIDPARDAAAIAQASGETLPEVSSEALAYIIYTSGSTGTPKGVEITHANLAHLAKWHREAFGVSSNDRASHLAGLGFDASAWEIWPSLSSGATLCIPRDAVLSSVDLVRDWMLRESVTIGFVPSIYAAAMMDMDWPASTTLRFLLTGGDVFPRYPSKKLPFSIVNNYGPTECTVVATSTILATGEAGTPTIGKPIDGTTIYLMDQNLKEVPAGTPGEICIGGDKVGRGYRNLPEMTKERFIPDPFASVPGARMYRSGDSGMLRPDGLIQFLGRLDRQVKIKGKRMELDEVGNVLSRHPGISFATVVAAKDPANDDKRLVAYVILKPEHDTNRDQLVTHLAQHLPDFMIPAVFVRLQQVPLSSSGKLDYAALPTPSDSNLLQSSPKEKGGTPIEQQLLAIIQQLLHGKPIGVSDNVFLAGGDSLLGMQLIIELKAKFSIELTFDQIFEAPTVTDLARLIEERGKVLPIAAAKGNEAGQGAQLPPGVLSMQKKISGKPIFWVHYLNVNLDKALGQDRPMTFLILAKEDIAALGTKPTLEDMATRLVKKILTIQPQGPYTIGGYCLGALLSYEIAAQLQKAGHVVSLLIMVDAPAPSDLTLRNPFGIRLSNPGYILKRMKKLGLRASWNRIRVRLAKFIHPAFPETAQPEFYQGQALIEAAASVYQSQKYNGRVLLLLAGQNPPHINFLPMWQKLVPNNLHFEYIPAHHHEIMNQPHVHNIANAISAQIEQVSQESTKISCSASLPESNGSQCGTLDRTKAGGPCNFHPKMPAERELVSDGNLLGKQS